jgi:hypothetical protein
MRRSVHRLHPGEWLFLFALITTPLVAQQDTGVIAGTVLDPGGALVPQVALKIINTGTNFAVEITTDLNGDFVSPPLRIGVYRLEAEKTGFKR